MDFILNCRSGIIFFRSHLVYGGLPKIFCWEILFLPGSNLNLAKLGKIGFSARENFSNAVRPHPSSGKPEARYCSQTSFVSFGFQWLSWSLSFWSPSRRRRPRYRYNKPRHFQFFEIIVIFSELIYFFLPLLVLQDGLGHLSFRTFPFVIGIWNAQQILSVFKHFVLRLKQIG